VGDITYSFPTLSTVMPSWIKGDVLSRTWVVQTQYWNEEEEEEGILPFDGL